MTGEFDQVHTEIAHVLFIDIVEHSTTSLPTQARALSELNALVSGTNSYSQAKAKGLVMPIPTGDGMALLFTGNVAAPAECAREIAKASSGIRLRIGIHSGLVHKQMDISGHENVVGEGINTAQRVMSEAGEGQILLSSQYAQWLMQFDEWKGLVYPVGEAVTKHNLRLELYGLWGKDFGKQHSGNTVVPQQDPLRLIVLYRRKAEPDEQLLGVIEEEFTRLGHRVFIDRHLKIGVEWAKAIEEEIRSADGVIAIISDQSAGSEMLEYEVEIARDEFLKRGKPYLLPVRVGSDRPAEGAIGSIVNPLNFTVWMGPEDNTRIIAELISSLREPLQPKATDRQLEPIGGAVLPDSPFYIRRETDDELAESIRANESIVLLKGPRQIGKTSALSQGLKLVRDLGWKQVLTDFQKLSSTQLADEEKFYKLLAATLCRQLDFKFDFSSDWLDVFGPNMNMDNFVRSLLEQTEGSMVWFMDETDKLFGSPFASDFFGLVRSWHNSRATDPSGPWHKLTLVIAYATEAHLFIRDLNQSPFNVGRHLLLRNFTLAETAELNSRYGSPLKDGEVAQLHELVAGQPFLTRRALDTVARGTMSFPALLDRADRDDGPFGDHLKRILVSVTQIPEVLEAMKRSLTSPQLPESEESLRLVAAGILRRTDPGRAELTCQLYKSYLASHLQPAERVGI